MNAGMEKGCKPVLIFCPRRLWAMAQNFFLDVKKKTGFDKFS